LEISGYLAALSSSAEEAIKRLEKQQCDVVITDIFMPGMGGIEGIKAIRQIAPNVKIIAVSGGFSDMPSNDALLAAQKLGADATLAKPFEFDALEATILDVTNS